jgi:hypothetical protein
LVEQQQLIYVHTGLFLSGKHLMHKPVHKCTNMGIHSRIYGQRVF